MGGARPTGGEPGFGALLARLEALGRPPVDPLEGDLAALQRWVRQRQELLDAVRERAAAEALDPESRRQLGERLRRLHAQDQAVLAALARRQEALEAQLRQVVEARAAVRGYGSGTRGREPGSSVDRTA